MSTPDLLEELVSAHLAKKHDDIEAMVERMLVTPGEYGVLVESWPSGGYRVTLSADIEPMTIGYMNHA